MIARIVAALREQLLGYVAVAVVAVLAVGVLVELWLTWPQFVMGLAVGATVMAGIDRRQGIVGRLNVEALAQRKDAAVEGALEVAFSAQELEQRISGEHQAVDMYDATQDQHPLCSWCEAPATARIDVTVDARTPYERIVQNLPSCASCKALVEVGELSPADAYPDQAYPGAGGVRLA